MRFESNARNGPARRAFLKGLAACLAGPLLRVHPAWAGGLRVGAPAPAATLVTLDGQRLSTSDMLEQVVILTFCGTWCSPCRDELPLLSDISRSTPTLD